MSAQPDRNTMDFVLIVDDEPDNLAVLHDALDEAGYTVFVAIDGEAALQLAQHNPPDIILLDALMPGIDGFEVCRRLKTDSITQHIPVVFMTGLTESEHVVAAFEAGGTDYLTKPIHTSEAIARIASHLKNSRLMEQTRSALDAFGQATAAISLEDGRLRWQTPLARKLLQEYFSIVDDHVPAEVLQWLTRASETSDAREAQPLHVSKTARRLTCVPLYPSGDNEWLILLREESEKAYTEALRYAFKLTPRESEVLYWVSKGKTNRDIGDILGASPRTVNKHLERVFIKLGVETRTAAANLAMSNSGAGYHASSHSQIAGP